MRKIIAGIEIVGGILVLIMFILQIGMMLGLESSHGSTITFTPWSLSFILQASIPLIFGLINIIAGITLWKNKKVGYKLSIITQLIQLVSIQTPNFYAYCYSLFGCIYAFSITGVKSLYAFGFGYRISFNPQPVTTTFIGINIVALVLLVLIIVLFRKKS